MSKINSDFWLKNFGKTFSTFFNENNSKRGSWGVTSDGKPVSLVISSNAENKIKGIFTNDNIKLLTGKDDMNIYQFIIMASIMINETGGTFVPEVAEGGGLDYMFNAISGVKVSYNCAGANPCSSLGNKSAYDLFHDSMFMNVPARASMIKPKNINDIAWKGSKYPSGEPKGITKFTLREQAVNYETGGIIAECDFYKFRGRGLIQLTGRANYKIWLEALRTNKGNITFGNQTSLPLINSWGTTDIDTIATKITNKELDMLFSDAILSIFTLRTHNSNKIIEKMYDVNTPSDFLDLVYKYGKTISGGKPYAELFTNRVFELMSSMNWVLGDTADTKTV